MIHHQASQIVLNAANTAGIQAPRLSVKRLKQCHAVYHPFKHHIVIDDRLAHGLELESLKALLAHEVGHAAQRQDLMRHAAAFGLPLLGGCLMCVLAMAYIGMTGTTTQMGVLLILFFLPMVAWERVALPRWWKIVAQREHDADAFAESFVGTPGAMKTLSADCRQLLHE